MKWRILKAERYSKNLDGLRAQRDNMEFRICDLRKGWEQIHKGWYVMITHRKKDSVYNSLWNHIKFDTKEDAKYWCEKIKWEDLILNDSAL